jgi:alpha-N-arabinofuranosidase
MLNAKLILDRDFTIGEVDPRLFGGFAEHLGRHIYGGIYEPEHPTADEDDFRTDVIDLVKELGMTTMRYPGGNFVSGYNWEDGVGPRSERPARLDLAWKTTESNQFGTNEFIAWCRKVGAEPILAVNLGTRGPEEARSLVEYCNHPSGTYWSDLRRKHGYEAPHAVKYWCLGNEVDGPWQMGHKTAQEYGRVALETAKLMKLTDPSIELVACGSSHRGMPTFGDWELDVLSHTLEQVEYLSIHSYFGNTENDTPKFLSRPEAMGDFIEETIALCDAAAARKKSRKRIMLSFDEWNVWFHSHGDRQSRSIKDWDAAPPLLEDAYTMEDALVVGGMLIQLINHCDRVKIGCIAQVVNVIAPIMTANCGPAWRQTIFYPFKDASAWAKGIALQPVVESPHYEVQDRECVPYLTTACIHNPVTGELNVLAVNRSLDTPMELNVELRTFGIFSAVEWTLLQNDDLKAVNTIDAPDTVTPRKESDATITGQTLQAVLPAASWNVLRLSKA